MAETSVKQKTCQACGADVRPNSMFCYNCGSSVTNGKTEVSDVWLRESLAEENGETSAQSHETTKLDAAVVEEKLAAPREIEEVEKTEKFPKTTTIQEEAKLKSAAAMRRKAKSFQQKEVQVVWEDAEDASNAKLIIASVLLLIFAVAIVAIAFYLK